MTGRSFPTCLFAWCAVGVASLMVPTTAEAIPPFPFSIPWGKPCNSDEGCSASAETCQSVGVLCDLPLGAPCSQDKVCLPACFVEQAGCSDGDAGSEARTVLEQTRTVTCPQAKLLGASWDAAVGCIDHRGTGNKLPDAGAAVPDSGVPDSGMDAAQPDASSPARRREASGGCAVRVSNSVRDTPLAALYAIGIALLALRRQRRRAVAAADDAKPGRWLPR